jgi:hypothetical protein
MDLEEMKNTWGEMSNEIDKQKKLTDKLIMMMTQEKYNNTLRRISIPETIGTVICFAMVLLVIFNFEKLDTWYLQLSGLLSVATLIVLPILSLRSIKKMNSINISKNNIKQTMIDFNKGKKQFRSVQKIGFYMSFIILIVSLPVAGKLMNNKDLFLESTIWFWYVPFGVIGLYFFAKWVFKYYMSSTSEAENILKELDN